MAKSEVITFPNGCGIIKVTDLDYDKICLESLKKDLIDWCKADRKEWLRNDLNAIYNDLYVQTRKERFDNAVKNAETEEIRIDYLSGKRKVGINMDVIKNNAIIRYCVERIKMYGTKENCIAELGETAFNRLFCHDKGATLDTRWEIVQNMMENGFE